MRKANLKYKFKLFRDAECKISLFAEPWYIALNVDDAFPIVLPVAFP